jgi:hypothetical protein
MGWFQRTFSNSPEARLERAERYWLNHEYNKVRLELEELSDSRAQDLYNMAVQKLLKLNLEEAHARYSSGDSEGAESHLELAKQFGASRQQIQETRNSGRSIQAEDQAKRVAAAQRKAASKHFQGDDPIWSLPPDDPRLQYAIHLEGYPAELRERLIPLGQEFAQAVLAIQQGNGQQIVATLSNYIEREPAVRYERARAAMSIGDFSLAISDLMLFGKEVGHQVINNTHTGALLGQLMAQMGRGSEGIDTMTELLEDDQHISMRIVRSQLFYQLGKLDIAEKETQLLLKELPKSQPLIRQLAQIRVDQDNRISAANVLEAGFATCCATGTCSAQPPDIQSVRLLARIYLEDRVLPERTDELLQQLRGLVQQPTWEDQYLMTLHARNNGDSVATSLASQLYQVLKDGDPRRAWVEQAFEL